MAEVCGPHVSALPILALKGLYWEPKHREPQGYSRNIIGIYLRGSLYSIIFLLYSWGSLFGVPSEVHLCFAEDRWVPDKDGLSLPARVTRGGQNSWPGNSNLSAILAIWAAEGRGGMLCVSRSVWL